MGIPRFSNGLAVAIGVVCVICGNPADANDNRVSQRRPGPTVATTTQPSQAFLDAIPAPFRENVNSVIRTSTLAAKASEEPFTAHSKVYDWLVDHPDRSSLAWRRMDVPCVEIKDLGNGKFFWTDSNGSELTWQVAAKFTDGMVWYATGKVKASAVMPMVPVKAVAILKMPRKAADTHDEIATFEPSVNVYLQTDSRAATVLLKMVGPAAPRMAEQGAEQLLLFFSGPARYIHDHPDEATQLLAPAKK